MRAVLQIYTHCMCIFSQENKLTSTKRPAADNNNEKDFVSIRLSTRRLLFFNVCLHRSFDYSGPKKVFVQNFAELHKRLPMKCRLISCD